MNVKALDNRVIVETEQGYKQNEGSGIAIAVDSAWDKVSKGIVKFVGEGRKGKNGEIIPNDVKVGDIVLYDRSVRKEILIDNIKYFHIREVDIIAIIEE